MARHVPLSPEETRGRQKRRKRAAEDDGDVFSVGPGKHFFILVFVYGIWVGPHLDPQLVMSREKLTSLLELAGSRQSFWWGRKLQQDGTVPSVQVGAGQLVNFGHFP